VTDYQSQAACPQCGSAAAVHSIQELMDLVQGKLDGLPPGYGQPQPGPPPGPPPGPQPGWVGEPQSGPPPGPQAGWVGEPQAGPPPGPVPGWARTPQSGPPPGPVAGPGGLFDVVWSMRRPGRGSVEDEIADVAIGAATRFIGRKLGKKMQQAYTERVQPAMAAKRQEMLRETATIADRHPGLRACLTDKVIFLAGGSRTVPLDELTGPLSVEQADALVARLT
jgi:hypothetical protein